MTNHPHRKKWGQNFIEDPNIIKKIVETINPGKDDNIIEIGPGQGAITNKLHNRVNKLVAVEIDPLLCEPLKETLSSETQIINQDILKLDFNNYSNYNKIVGNLPYYITTPIIFKVLQHPFWDTSVFMVQKEVAERIVAVPGNKVYGRLSVMVQVMADVNKRFNISKNIFHPKPKVDSSLIELTIKKNNDLNNLNILSDIVRTSFGQRRKMLKNSLNNLIPIHAYDKYKNKRPEELSVDNYIEISNNI